MTAGCTMKISWIMYFYRFMEECWQGLPPYSITLNRNNFSWVADSSYFRNHKPLARLSTVNYKICSSVLLDRVLLFMVIPTHGFMQQPTKTASIGLVRNFAKICNL